MSRRPRIVPAALLLGAVVLAGCGSEASQLADAGLRKAACSAVSSIDGRLAGAEDASPEELETLRTQAKAVRTAIDAVGDQIPATLKTKVDDAVAKLDEAIESAKTGASGAKDEVKAATADLRTALDEASAKLDC